MGRDGLGCSPSREGTPPEPRSKALAATGVGWPIISSMKVNEASRSTGPNDRIEETARRPTCSTPHGPHVNAWPEARSLMKARYGLIQWTDFGSHSQWFLIGCNPGPMGIRCNPRAAEKDRWASWYVTRPGISPDSALEARGPARHRLPRGPAQASYRP